MCFYSACIFKEREKKRKKLKVHMCSKMNLVHNINIDSSK